MGVGLLVLGVGVDVWGHHHHHHWVVGDGDSRRIWSEMSRWRNAMMRSLA